MFLDHKNGQPDRTISGIFYDFAFCKQKIGLRSLRGKNKAALRTYLQAPHDNIRCKCSSLEHEAATKGCPNQPKVVSNFITW